MRFSRFSRFATAHRSLRRYTAVKAELDKAELERDALLDALRETRSTLSDVRSQRDNLDAELKREKQLTALVKQVSCSNLAVQR